MFRVEWKLFAAVLYLTAAPAQAQITANLGANWSDSSNPNSGSFGSWSYLQGTSLLPHVADWTPLGAAAPQPAWAPGTAAGNFLPAEFKATSAQFNWLTGDVVLHSTDPTNGGSNGFADFRWTTPITGTAQIAGSVFEGRVSAGLSNTWLLVVNGLIVTQGTLNPGDGHDRTNPFLFSDGSGGSGALLIPNVAVGTTFDLIVAKTAASQFGDFVGVNYSISVVPEPASACLVGIAMMAMAMRQRRIARG
jgi:hypothetical protein